MNKSIMLCTTILQVLLGFFYLSGVNGQKLLPYGVQAGDEVFSAEDWSRGYTTINLTNPIGVYGRGNFEKIFINTVGAVSLGGPLLTDLLDDVRHDDVIAFAPFLISINKESFESKTISYRFAISPEEISAVEAMFRANVADSSFTVQLALIVTFDYTVQINQTKLQRNNFQFMLVSDGERTYIKYGYRYLQHIKSNNRYARVGRFSLAEGAMICSNEVEVSGTEKIKNLWNHSNTGSRGNFYWRVDLPLRCTNFTSDCGKTEELSEDFNLNPIGYFMDTVTSNMWRFYALYFCKRGTTRRGGTVSVKQQCRYDSDYYLFEWRELDDLDQCSVTLNDSLPDSL